MAIIKLNNNALTSVTALPSGVGADPNVKVDLARLGLRVFANQNLVATNSNSASYDVFQDDSGIGTETNTDRNASEYVSSAVQSIGSGSWTTDSSTSLLLSSDQVSSGSTTFTDESSTTTITGFSGIDHRSTGGAPTGLGSNSISFNGSSDYLTLTNSDYQFGTSDYTIEWWMKTSSSSEGYIMYNADTSTGLRISLLSNGKIHVDEQVSNSAGVIDSDSTTVNDGSWHHIALVRHSGGRRLFVDGTQASSDSTSPRNFNNSNTFRIGRRESGTYYSGYLAEIRISTTPRYSSNFTPQQVSLLTTSATGNFISNAITATSSTSKMGAVITYKDQAGTNALNSDLVLQLSADNGSNFSTATLTALPDFASGVKCCKVSDVSVTAGTQLKYKISFANQSGSKECRVTGVSLQY
nr:putative lectin [uncultured Mediterranean phage uvMED]